MALNLLLADVYPPLHNKYHMLSLLQYHHYIAIGHFERGEAGRKWRLKQICMVDA
jgi:hypothetical protein